MAAALVLREFFQKIKVILRILFHKTPSKFVQEFVLALDPLFNANCKQLPGTVTVSQENLQYFQKSEFTQ
jgi:hypothetical protein